MESQRKGSQKAVERSERDGQPILLDCAVLSVAWSRRRRARTRVRLAAVEHRVHANPNALWTRWVSAVLFHRAHPPCGSVPCLCKGVATRVATGWIRVAAFGWVGVAQWCCLLQSAAPPGPRCGPAGDPRGIPAHPAPTRPPPETLRWRWPILAAARAERGKEVIIPPCSI